MAVAVAGSVGLSVAMQAVNALDGRNATDPVTLSKIFNFQNGTGAGNANKMFYDVRSITSGGTDNVDLSGALTDAFGTSLLFTKVKALILISDPTNTVNLTVGNGTNPVVGGPWGVAGANPLVMQPGDMWVFANNSANGIFPVTAATGDILKIVAGAANSNYTIIVIGE